MRMKKGGNEMSSLDEVFSTYDVFLFSVYRTLPLSFITFEIQKLINKGEQCGIYKGEG